ncbi:MAG: transporter substrate-binding domain-containing protein [Pseudomonadota bacterium]
MLRLNRVSSRILLSLLTFFLFFGVPGSEAGGTDGTVSLGHIESFKPFAEKDGDQSKGLAVDLIRAALKKVNRDVRFVPAHQDKIQDLVKEGKLDGVVFLAINPDRKDVYDFSIPYLISGGALFVKAPAPASWDLKEFEGRTVATPEKGPLAGYIKTKFPKVKVITSVKDYPETLETVLNGKADAAALNTQSGTLLAKKRFPGKFSLPERGFLETPIGVGVLKGTHKEFLADLNKGLEAILADGTYDKILKQWEVPGTTKPKPPK